MVTITEIDSTTPDYPTENPTNPNITGHTSDAHSFHRRNPNFQSQGSRILRQDFDSNITCPNCHTNIDLSHNHNHDPTVPHRDVSDEIPTIPLAQPNVSHQVTIVPSTSCDIIKYDPSGQLPEILANLNVTPEKWCFFAFNNNSNLGHYGGSHWSLIVYDPRRKHCALVDSMYDGVPPLIQEVTKLL
uniref:Ubiquitin-like protease family profile domain-containing protein n=1 Tax=Acrobeloides nanus TaxID=290746 RepID=A0A914DX75_9BILA